MKLNSKSDIQNLILLINKAKVIDIDIWDMKLIMDPVIINFILR